MNMDAKLANFNQVTHINNDKLEVKSANFTKIEVKQTKYSI